MSCATAAAGLVGDTKITVPARLRVCIESLLTTRFHVMPTGLRLAVSRRKLAVTLRSFVEHNGCGKEASANATIIIRKISRQLWSRPRAGDGGSWPIGARGGEPW